MLNILPVKLLQIIILQIILISSIGICNAQTSEEENIPTTSNQPAEKPIATREQASQRPNSDKGPTVIYFLAFVLDIDGINDAKQNFEGNFFIQLRWKDERLANPKGTTRQVPLTEIWNPRLLVTNQQGKIHNALPKIAEVHPDGTVIMRQRYTGTLSQPLYLLDFPMDQHKFTIQFASAGYDNKDIVYLPDYNRVAAGGIADELSLPDWEITSFAVESAPYQPVAEISSAGFKIEFEAKRIFNYYIWQILLPLSVVVVMSWAAFWVGADQVGVRIGIATSSILTLIAHRFVIASLLPKLPYMTKLDYFSVYGTCLVLLSLIVVVFQSLFVKRNKLIIVERIDLVARVLFPLAYLGFILNFIGYLN